MSTFLLLKNLCVCVVVGVGVGVGVFFVEKLECVCLCGVDVVWKTVRVWCGVVLRLILFGRLVWVFYCKALVEIFSFTTFCFLSHQTTVPDILFLVIERIHINFIKL